MQGDAPVSIAGVAGYPARRPAAPFLPVARLPAAAWARPRGSSGRTSEIWSSPPSQPVSLAHWCCNDVGIHWARNWSALLRGGVGAPGAAASAPAAVDIWL